MLICDKRRPASREQPTLAPQRGANRPPRAGRFASLAQPYAPRLGRSRTGGATPPRPPRAAPPVRPSAHGPRPSVAQRGRGWARWVVPTERSDWGQHSSGKDCLRNPLLPHEFIKTVVWQAKRVRPKAEPLWSRWRRSGCMWSSRAFCGLVHMCPRRASLSIRQNRQGGGATRFPVFRLFERT